LFAEFQFSTTLQALVNLLAQLDIGKVVVLVASTGAR
jgi:hypothetical protein